MAQYDLSKLIEKTGMTAEEIAAEINRRGIEADQGTLIAWNRAAQSAALEWLATHEAKDAKTSAPMCTERQAAYILSLLHRRNAQGVEDGFMVGPTTYEGITKLTRGAASAYINSLKGTY